MATVTLAQAQRDLAALIRKVQDGETVIIVDENHPVAELHAIKLNGPASMEPRPFGLAAGEFTIADNFDEPLPEDVLRRFEGR